MHDRGAPAARLWEHIPHNHNVDGLIPSQGTFDACRTPRPLSFYGLSNKGRLPKIIKTNCFSLQKLDSMSGVFVDKTKTETNRISNDYNKYIFSCKHKTKTWLKSGPGSGKLDQIFFHVSSWGWELWCASLDDTTQTKSAWVGLYYLILAVTKIE